MTQQTKTIIHVRSKDKNQENNKALEKKFQDALNGFASPIVVTQDDISVTVMQTEAPVVQVNGFYIAKIAYNAARQVDADVRPLIPYWENITPIERTILDQLVTFLNQNTNATLQQMFEFWWDRMTENGWTTGDYDPVDLHHPDLGAVLDKDNAKTLKYRILKQAILSAFPE